MVKIVTRSPINDCFVLNDSVMKDTCTCDWQYMEIGASFNPYGVPQYRVYRAFLSIDLSEITTDNLISAVLNLYDRTQSGTLIVRRVTNNWSCPTWNNQPITTDVNQVTFSSSVNNWASVDVTQLIKDIINSRVNYGLGIVEASANCGSPAFNSIELGSNKPYFEFTIEEPTYIISGSIFNNDSIPVKDAIVNINGTEVSTDENGYYSTTVEPGTYNLEVSKRCYYGDTIIVIIIDSDVVQNFVIDCIEHEECLPCEQDKLDWWLLIVGAVIGHILTKNNRKDKK